MTSANKSRPKCSSKRATIPPSVTKGQLRALLTYSLAAYVGTRAEEPISVVMNDLFEIEFKAASLVEAFVTEKIETPNLRGSLAGVFSTIPIGKKRSIRDVTPAAGRPPFPTRLETKSQIQMKGKGK